MIIAFAVFMLVKWMNSLTRKRAPDEPPPAPPPEPSEEAKLLSEIRDLLKARG
jgi:large conductance mechanosensitive channel